MKREVKLIRKDISIHALVKRATTLTVTGAAIADISIHALVKRATRPAGNGVLRDYFNPRPRKEGDRFIVFIILRLCEFQSTPS